MLLMARSGFPDEIRTLKKKKKKKKRIMGVKPKEQKLCILFLLTVHTQNDRSASIKFFS